jgi:methylthioribulose-1-phosphate dehydratase
MRPTLPDVTRSLAGIGRDFHARGWVLGTSGNFSAVLDRNPVRLAITASGVSKGALRSKDVLVVGPEGRLVGKTPGRAVARPSAETPLHLLIARTRGAGAVLHTHSMWSTILSERHARDGGLTIHGFEMLKGLEGVQSHIHDEWIPIVDNDQDMERLALAVESRLNAFPAVHAFLLRRHGLYTWGRSLDEATRHIEILEFLLETVGRG